MTSLQNVPRLRPIYVYCLMDPFTSEIRYIGKTDNPKSRLAAHCNDQSTCHRTNWIRSVLAKGKRPIMHMLQEVPFWAHWQTCERMWIQFGLDRGWNLTNSTLGGDGVDGLSGEGRERVRKAWIGRKHRLESLVKIGAASKGRKHTEAYKQHMREIMSVRTFTTEHRRRLSQSAWQRLPDEKRQQITDLLNSGVRVTDIAAIVGVHRVTVSRIKHNRKN